MSEIRINQYFKYNPVRAVYNLLEIINPAWIASKIAAKILIMIAVGGSVPLHPRFVVSLLTESPGLICIFPRPGVGDGGFSLVGFESTIGRVNEEQFLPWPSYQSNTWVAIWWPQLIKGCYCNGLNVVLDSIFRSRKLWGTCHAGNLKQNLSIWKWRSTQ